MMPEAGKDYSLLLRSPEQFRQFLAAFQMKDPKGHLKPPTLEHPVFELPPVETVVALMAQRDGLHRLHAALVAREEQIYWMREDPLHHGYEPGLQDKRRACWADARELLRQYRIVHITSRNRNTKTQFGAKETVRTLVQGKKIVWCACGQEKESKRGGGQQEVVWNYFPPGWRAARGQRGKAVEYAVNYSPANKFADNQCITPNQSEVQFMNYKQDIDIIEGGAIDFFWFDELAPIEWVLTMIFRLIDRDGHGLLTFTPKNGWNDTYGHIYQGCRVVEWQDLEVETDKQHWPGGPKGKIPYIVESVDRRFAGMFFPPDSNPFVSFESVLKECQNLSYEQKMIRMAGVARNRIGNQFPKFGAPHIIAPERVPKKGTNYHFVDFAWERNWAQLWVRVVRVKDRVQYFVYRDWPDQKTHGEWVEASSRPNGSRGPAQDKVGLNVQAYRDLVLGLESLRTATNKEQTNSAPEKIRQRYGDPRSGAAEAVTVEDAGISFFTMLAEVGLDFMPVSLLGEARFIGEGVKQINDLLDYDEEQYRAAGNRFTPVNEPRLFISSECQQVIDCLRLWKGQGPKKEQSSADFIDLLRYMVVEDLDDCADAPLVCRGGGSY
jgi:hypothetical protein